MLNHAGRGSGGGGGGGGGSADDGTRADAKGGCKHRERAECGDARDASACRQAER